MRASTCSPARNSTTPTSGEPKIMTSVFKIQKGGGGGGHLHALQQEVLQHLPQVRPRDGRKCLNCTRARGWG